MQLPTAREPSARLRRSDGAESLGDLQHRILRRAPRRVCTWAMWWSERRCSPAGRRGSPKFHRRAKPRAALSLPSITWPRLPRRNIACARQAPPSSRWKRQAWRARRKIWVYRFTAFALVSDLANESFATDFNSALGADGRFSTMRLVLQLKFGELLRLKQRTELASKKLGEFLDATEF